MHLSNKSDSFFIRKDAYTGVNDEMCWSVHCDFQSFTHVAIVSMDFAPFTNSLTCVKLNLLGTSVTDTFGTAAVLHDKNGYHPNYLSMRISLSFKLKTT